MKRNLRENTDEWIYKNGIVKQAQIIKTLKNGQKSGFLKTTQNKEAHRLKLETH